MLKYSPDSVNYRDLARLTPLHHAAKRRCKRSVQILLMHGANINSLDECDFTSLHSACRMQSQKEFDFHGAELEQCIRNFAVGAREDGEEIIQTMRDAGAEIDMPLFDGLYGPASTLDSFLYDPNVEVTILFAQFAHTADSDGPPLIARGSFPYTFWAKNAPIYLFLLQCYHPQSWSVLREREALGISISSAMSYPTRTSSSFVLAGLMARPILHPHTSLSRCMQRRVTTISFQTIEELILSHSRKQTLCP